MPEKAPASMRSIERLRQAAAGDDNGARYQLARVYDKGWNVARDPREAFRWYLAAANAGHSEAAYRAVSLYLRGHAADDEASAALLHKAAELGHPESEALLGWCYQQGRGVPQSDDQALRW